MTNQEKGVKVALISADLGRFRGNPGGGHVQQELPAGWVADSFFLDDESYPARPSLSPRLQAKIPKMLGYEMIPGYDYYIWLDSSFSLADPGAVAWLVQACAGRDMAVFKHPHRGSIREELNYIVEAMSAGDRYLTERYQKEPLREQVALYLADPAFRDDALYAMGAFVYSKEMLARPEKNVMPLWYYHNARYSIQDQLSFPYLAAGVAGNGFRLATFDAGIFDNRYIAFRASS